MRIAHALPMIASMAVLAAAPGAFATAPPGYVTFVVAGAQDPALPAFNAVSGAGVNNVAIANPINVLVHGHSYLYSIWSHDQTFSGTCVTGYVLSQTLNGVKKTLDSRVLKSYSCAPGTDWLWVGAGRAVPDSPGPAVLTGVVKFGTHNIGFAVPMLIQ